MAITYLLSNPLEPISKMPKRGSVIGKKGKLAENKVFYSEWYKLSFVKCDDGIVRVQGIDQNDKIHLFDISIVDENVHLSENGVPIG